MSNALEDKSRTVLANSNNPSNSPAVRASELSTTNTMCKVPLYDFLSELPKCEHHLHLEGCLTPALLFRLAAKNNIRLPSADENPAYASPEALAKRYEHFDNLEDFLQCYYRAMRALVTEEDFEVLGWEYFTNAHRDGVQHAEVFFDPQSHTSRGVSFKTIVTGFYAACRRAKTEFGITSRLIMCFLRHLPVTSASDTMRAAIDGKYFDAIDEGESPKISALGLDSSEVGFRPELFKEFYLEAEKRNIHRTAHGGEEGDPTYISGALDTLHVERIDHGIRLVEDPELLQQVVKEGIMLTICPLSNLCLQVVKDIRDLLIKEFLAKGVKFSLNSDDPAYFRGYVLNNYLAVQDAFRLSIDDWKVIAQDSVQGSWIGKERKDELLAMIDDCVIKYSSL
ncbi:adenosine deaminase [Periconia macrospinosa]|uniref:Adenine deaminase n=1 Tax=Periconia macrospinosa TaxID=97972 RepID=A0A2V1E8R2_9PLEO|nr:adenosine deaminase [Periconia macrospinosa]